jgi:hypothetical protein
MASADGTVRVVEFEVNYKVIDLYWVYFSRMFRRQLWVFILVPAIVIPAGGFMTGDFSFIPYFARSPWPAVWVLLLIFFLFGRPYLISLSLLQKDPFRFGSARYKIDDQAINVQRQDSQSTILWPSVRKATESSTIVTLSLGPYTPIILPKRSLSSSVQLTILRSLIREHARGIIHLQG